MIPVGQFIVAPLWVLCLLAAPDPLGSHARAREGTATPRFRLEDISSRSGNLVYKDHRVSISIKPDESESSITVKRGKRTLVRLHNRHRISWLRYPEQVAFFPLLGKKTKQLIVALDSGGAHCCLSVTIYDLFPRFRVIYDSAKWNVGETWNGVRFLDINRDGVFELEDDLLAFAGGFDRLEGVSSPRVPMVFRYSPLVGAYRPANHLFPAYALRGVDEERRTLRALKRTRNETIEYLMDTMDVLLRTIYAGRERAAWSFFNATYSYRFLSRARLKRDVRRLLIKDQAYRIVYDY